MVSKKISALAICLAVIALLSAIAITSSMAAKDEMAAQAAAAQDSGRKATGTQDNTFYEAVKEIGFNPQTRVLDGVTAVYQTYGFNGFEYVSFWIDWNNNNVFEISEYAGTGIAYIPNPAAGTASPTNPLMYSISTPVSPPPGLPAGSVRKVRAVLSWVTPPINPTTSVTWGNRIDRNVRFDPIR